MCRIVGLINFKAQMNAEKALIAMRDSMAHGGPDDAGIFIDRESNVAIGNRRLSILDLSPLGHQPMCNDDESLWITYNGEIYNFPELKSELQSLGYQFKSNSDTEVILKAFEQWREKAFEKLIGMFAFCIYDKNLEIIYLVRDHAGIKPLYCSFKKNVLIFASEIKAFKTLDSSWNENPDWKIFFLLFGHIPEPFTTLKDVYMLEKGSFLQFDLKTKKHHVKKYTTFTFSDKISNQKKAENGIRELFIRSVKRHLISDAPIGVFLSGGIDSSLIALIASQQKHDLRTLSVIFDEKDYSEERYQNMVIEKIKSRHKAYLVRERDFIEGLDDIFLAMDQPTIDGINSYFIAKCAKEEGLKAVLSGLGGDELFGGYPSFNRIDRVWFLRNSRLKSLSVLSEYLPDSRYQKLSFLSVKEPLNYYLLFRGIFPMNTAAAILDTDRKDIIQALEKINIEFDDAISPKNFVSSLETNLYMQNQLLKDTDFMSMWHSVEVRVPFLDKELMDYTFSIKESVKFNSGIPKNLLLKTFNDMLPGDIVKRKKQGFTFPFQVWMRNNSERLLNRLSVDSKKPVNNIINSFNQNKLHWSRFWALAVMKEWNTKRM